MRGFVRRLRDVIAEERKLRGETVHVDLVRVLEKTRRVIERAAQLMHGKTSDIRHCGRGIFADLPDPFVATRYHSLCLNRESVPECFDVLADSADGTIMAIAHRELPYWGVQFHPESVLTEVGGRLMSNFLAMI